MGVLSEQLREKILACLPRYPNKQAVTLPALHLIQDTLRCVPLEAIREIAELLDLSPAEVRDTMSFYGFFRPEDNPLGRTRIWVCRSLACSLRGGEEVLVSLCQGLGVQPGATTQDGCLSLEFAECLGMCDEAPGMLVNDVREGRLRPDVAENIILWLHQLRRRRDRFGPTSASHSSEGKNPCICGWRIR